MPAISFGLTHSLFSTTLLSPSSYSSRSVSSPANSAGSCLLAKGMIQSLLGFLNTNDNLTINHSRRKLANLGVHQLSNPRLNALKHELQVAYAAYFDLASGLASGSYQPSGFLMVPETDLKAQEIADGSQVINKLNHLAAMYHWVNSLISRTSKEETSPGKQSALTNIESLALRILPSEKNMPDFSKRECKKSLFDVAVSSSSPYVKREFRPSTQRVTDKLETDSYDELGGIPYEILLLVRENEKGEKEVVNVSYNPQHTSPWGKELDNQEIKNVFSLTAPKWSDQEVEKWFSVQGTYMRARRVHAMMSIFHTETKAGFKRQDLINCLNDVSDTLANKINNLRLKKELSLERLCQVARKDKSQYGLRINILNPKQLQNDFDAHWQVAENAYAEYRRLRLGDEAEREEAKNMEKNLLQKIIVPPGSKNLNSRYKLGAMLSHDQRKIVNGKLYKS